MGPVEETEGAEEVVDGGGVVAWAVGVVGGGGGEAGEGYLGEQVGGVG